MTDIPDSIKQLTDKQLRQELKNAGINAGPLTPTTRRLFQSKLAKKRGVLLAVVKNLQDFETIKEEKNETTTDNKEKEKNTKEQKNEKSQFYYGVFVPPNEGGSQQNNENIEPMVFESKSSALLLMREHKNARFKVFTAFEDAKNYSLNGKNSEKEIEKEFISSESEAANVDEEANAFVSLRQEDLNHFMLFLEKGDITNVKKLIWQNPRYLITFADSPVILKASTRYNALHVAAKYDQPQICCEVLSTVENPEFYKLLYSNVTDASVIEQRMEHLLDLYLNTPERGLFETPLHIASKFGFKDVISELLVYTQCCKTMKNKFGDMPADIVCTRASDENKHFKSEISNLLNEQYFIPLLRDFDNFERPIVGEPWDAKECSTNMSIFSPSSISHSPLPNTDSPLKPKRWLSALAGPMSKERATEMRNVWTTPSKLKKVGKKWSNLKKIDPEKGEEHVARHLASQEGVGLLEFWGFINEYADFSQVDGLKKLEEYLARKFRHRQSTESFDEIAELSQKLEKVHINSNTDVAEYSQKIVKLKSDDLPTENTHSPLQISDMNGEEDTQVKNHVVPSKENLFKNLFSGENENIDVVDSVENLTNLFSKKVDLKTEKIQAKEESSLPKPDMTTKEYHQDDVNVDLYKYRDLEETVSDVFSSPSSASHSSSNLGSSSQLSSSYSFLSGNMPTKLDRDVILAIGGTFVAPHEYPCIDRWKTSVLEFSECERERWGTPRRTTKSSTFLRDDTRSPSSFTPSTPSRNMRRFFCRASSSLH